MRLVYILSGSSATLCAGSLTVYQPSDRLSSSHSNRHGKGGGGLIGPKAQESQRRNLNKAICASGTASGCLIAGCTMTSYHTGMMTGSEAAASTMAFSTLTLARLFHGFNCRSGHSILKIGFKSNLWSIMAFEAGAILLAAVLFIPRLHTFFLRGRFNRKAVYHHFHICNYSYACNPGI